MAKNTTNPDNTQDTINLADLERESKGAAKRGWFDVPISDAEVKTSAASGNKMVQISLSDDKDFKDSPAMYFVTNQDGLDALSYATGINLGKFEDLEVGDSVTAVIHEVVRIFYDFKELEDEHGFVDIQSGIRAIGRAEKVAVNSIIEDFTGDRNVQVELTSVAFKTSSTGNKIMTCKGVDDSGRGYTFWPAVEGPRAAEKCGLVRLLRATNLSSIPQFVEGMYLEEFTGKRVLLRVKSDVQQYKDGENGYQPLFSLNTNVDAVAGI